VGLAFLVVEDHPLIGTTIQRALARHGQAELVETRAQALAAIADGGFDGVVADVGLPDGSGFDVVREVKRVSPNVPILILSGEVDHGRLREADTHDATYLLKPPAMSDLDRFATRVKEAAAVAAERVDLLVDRWAERHSLSRAETAILRIAAHGTRRSDLAEKRGVEPSTVKKQVQFLLAKTGDESLQECVSRLLREALLESGQSPTADPVPKER
jgi:DNA-binding NarL/FixJ family response regulator